MYYNDRKTQKSHHISRVRGINMNITKADIEKYLVDVFKAINTGNYQISPRSKNQDMYIDYIFTDDTAKEIILSLTVYDFSEAVPNEHSRYPDEILYIFGKILS